MPGPKTINEEAGLGPNWVPLDGPPIVPGQMVAAPPASDTIPTVPKFLSGTIAPNFQHDSDFTDTFSKSSKSPKFDLMPLGPQQNAITSAQTNSAVRSVLSTITSAAADVDTVVTDGLVHPTSPPPWWADPSFFFFRDDFTNWQGSGPLTDTINTQKGQVGLGWAVLSAAMPGGNLQPRLFGGAPPNIGQFSAANNATANQSVCLLLNHVDGAVFHAEQSWALLENPGWIATWIFKVAGEPTSTATGISDAINTSNKKQIYIGLSGASVGAIAQSGSTSRPSIFIGLRYDTSTMPPGMQITSVANASAGSTVYTGTFGSVSWAGQNVKVTNCSTNVNNGTFACTASTSTTLTLSNAVGVAETSNGALAVANPASIPLTSVSAASAGTTTYNYTALPGIGTLANSLLGLSLVFTGFTNSANNGTFTVLKNTTTTVTVNNPSGVAETHAGFATGGSINDSFWTFEASVNRQYGGTSAVSYVQGQTQVTTVPISAAGFHRLDMICAVAGQVKLVLDGTATATFTIPTIQIQTFGSASIKTDGSVAQVNFTVGPDASNSSFPNASYPPFGAGSKITFAGFTSPFTLINGTAVLDTQMDVSSSPVLYVPSTAPDNSASQSAFTATGYPALTPVAAWGNDTTAAPPTCFRMYLDFFSLCWGKGMVGAPASTSPTLARY